MQYYDGFDINHNAIPYFGDHLPEPQAAAASSSSSSSPPNPFRRKKSKTKSGHASLSPDVSLTAEQIGQVLTYFHNRPIKPE